MVSDVNLHPYTEAECGELEAQLQTQRRRAAADAAAAVGSTG